MGTTTGTSHFGEKAEEESRLIHDSGVKRSGQVRPSLSLSLRMKLMRWGNRKVFLVFAGAFGISVLMSGGNERRNGPKR